MKRTYTLVGAIVGFVVFVLVGLFPAIVYGGYAGTLLAGGIFGSPLHATLAVRALTTFGMVLGVAGIGSLFTVCGAVVGTAIGSLLSFGAFQTSEK